MSRYSVLIALIVAVTSAGCGGATGEPVVPPSPLMTSTVQASPSPVLQISTPASIGTMAASITTGPQGGVPAAPNSSLVRAQVIAVTHNGGATLLTLQVLHSQPQAGLADFGAAVVGKQIEASLLDQTGESLSVGQVISGELSYRGDEKGGIYCLRHVSQP